MSHKRQIVLTTVYRAKFQDAEGLKKKNIHHRSLDWASSLNFYLDSTRCFSPMTKKIGIDFRPINKISHQIYATYFLIHT